jgi:hypothetical protein
MEQSGYDWLDGYVFLRSPHSYYANCGLWADDVVRYVGKLEADPQNRDADRLIVFVEADKLEKGAKEKLDERVQRVIATANPTYSSATSVVVINGPTRWSEKLQWGAFIRIKAQAGWNPRDIFNALDPTRPDPPFPSNPGPYYGHALCDGDWDILLELGADKRPDLDPLIERALALPGVDREASIASRQKNFIHKPPRPQKTSCKEWDGRGSNGE